MIAILPILILSWTFVGLLKYGFAGNLSTLHQSAGFSDDFNSLNPTKWSIKHDVHDDSYLTYLDEKRIYVDEKEHAMVMSTIFNPKVYDDKLVNFATGAFRTMETYSFGCYEARIKPALSTATFELVYEFYLYGEGDVPGLGATTTKMDIIMIYDAFRSQVKIKTKAYSTHTEKTNYDDYFPPFDVEADYHTYGIKWTSRYIQFFLDGRPFKEYDISSRTEFFLPVRAWFGLYGQPWTEPLGLSSNQKLCRLQSNAKIDWFTYKPGEQCFFEQ